MTEAEIQQAEKDAEKDAEELALLLLLLLGKKDRAGLEVVRFDAAKGRFYYNGKSVSVTQIRKYLARIETRQARKLARLTEQLEKDEITIGEWKRQFDRSITTSHVLAGALALGGIAVAVRNAAIQEQIAEQLAFADVFAENIRSGKAGSLAKRKSRARSYVRAVHGTFVNIELEARRLMGVQTECRNRLRVAEHCNTGKQRIGCVELTRKGWMPLDEMVPIGGRQCGPWCKCWIEYR